MKAETLADSFVQIWKCIARPNVTIAFIKPLGRYMQTADSMTAKKNSIMFGI